MIASLVYLIGAIIFGLFASGEKQPWAMSSVKDKSDKAYDNPGLEVENLWFYLCLNVVILMLLLGSQRICYVLFIMWFQIIKKKVLN